MPKVFPAIVGAIAASTLAVAATARERQEVTLQFQGRVGEEAFTCGEVYDDLGTQGTPVAPADFRLYVSEVVLLDDRGNAVPVELTQDGRWQYGDVALLDFEDRTGPCRNGTAETRTIVVGTVPAGDYRGVRFSMGVPVALNHNDATLASSPLNLTSMWWNWRGGYKFLRVDLDLSPVAAVPHAKDQEVHHHSDDSHDGHKPMTAEPMSGHGDHGSHGDGEPAAAPGHGSHGGHGGHGGHSGHGDHGGGYTIHIGSTGCVEAAGADTICRFPNRPTVTFPNFDPAREEIAIDLAALLADTDLAVNAPGTPGGCMAGADDGDCTGIFRSLGLGDAPQTFFSIEPIAP